MANEDPYDLAALAAEQGRFNARPLPEPRDGDQSVEGDQPRGLIELGLGGERDGVLYVPPGYNPARPAPFVLMLHGATGDGRRGLRRLQSLADEVGLILLAPDSRRRTWDVLMGGYGPDVAFIDTALEQTFRRYTIDPAHLAIEGFSDGASYGLSLGIANGDLFTHILAFSPGFLSPPGQAGMPQIYVSHGTADQILPIDFCSRQLVPMLRRAGYPVEYHEFDGPHTVPPEIATEAVEWFVGA
jgi:phospholipase/carboxylesterase